MADESTLSEVSIFNAALVHLGQGTMLSPGGTDRLSGIFNMRYPMLRNALLRSYPWNFSTGRASLARDEAAPAFGFRYQYTAPSDCLRIFYVEGEPEAKWVFEDGKILTDLGAPLKIRYARIVTDASAFDPIFAEVLAMDLAVACVGVIGNKRTTKLDLKEMRKEVIESATFADADEGIADDLPDGSFVNSRRG